METLPKSTVYLKNIAAILGIIQGVTWVILSIFCLHIHYDATSDCDFPTSYFDSVNQNVAQYFLGVNCGRSESFENQIWKNTLSITFFLIYLLFDAVWALLSVAILFKGKHLKHVLIFWGLWTLLLCAIDLVLVIILGADYNSCMSQISYDSTSLLIQEQEAACATSILPVLVIAAKGFILWFINLLLAIVLILEAQHVDTEMIGYAQSPYSPGYNAYQDPKSYLNKPERSHFPHSNLPVLDPQGYNPSNNRSLDNRSPRTPTGNHSPYNPNFQNFENSLKRDYNQQQDNLRNFKDNLPKKQQRSRGANLPNLDIPYSNFREQGRNAENKFNRSSSNLEVSSPYSDNSPRNMQENFNNDFNPQGARSSFLQSIENTVQNAYDKAKKKISSPSSDKRFKLDRVLDPYGGPSFKNWNSPQPDTFYSGRR